MPSPATPNLRQADPLPHKLAQVMVLRNLAASGTALGCKIARRDSNDSQPGTMIFARKIFFPDSFSGLRVRQVQLDPRVAALHPDKALRQQAADLLKSSFTVLHTSPV